MNVEICWIIEPFKWRVTFRVRSLVGFPEKIKTCSSLEKIQYIKQLNISKLERYKPISLLNHYWFNLSFIDQSGAANKSLWNECRILSCWRQWEEKRCNIFPNDPANLQAGYVFVKTFNATCSSFSIHSCKFHHCFLATATLIRSGEKFIELPLYVGFNIQQIRFHLTLLCVVNHQVH